MNNSNNIAKNANLLYKDFPRHFVWDRVQHTWKERKRGVVIGRIVTVWPLEKERYYLRMLL